MVHLFHRVRELDGELEAPRYTATVAKWLGAIVVALAVYVLSIGPATYSLLHWGVPPPQLVAAVYYPVLRTASMSPKTAEAVSRYINFWMTSSGGGGGVIIMPAIEPPPTLEAEPKTAPLL